MKCIISPLQALYGVVSLVAFAVANPVLVKRADPIGIDVSDFTTGVNFNTVKANGVSFVYIKATEGTSESRLPHIRAALTRFE